MIAFPKSQRIEDDLLRAYLKRICCMACGEPPGNGMNPIDPSHVLTRGAGHPDAWWNVVSHCRRCHDGWERGRLDFLDAYPRFWNRLKAMGWTLENVLGKRRLWHPYLGPKSESKAAKESENFRM